MSDSGEYEFKEWVCPADALTEEAQKLGMYSDPAAIAFELGRETGRLEGIKAAAALFDLDALMKCGLKTGQWLCLDHGGEEAERIKELILGLLVKP